MPETDLERIASLLDDEDENVVLNALAELLYHEDELGDLPARLQESPDPRVRRHAHQLQVVLTLRRRRREFRSILYRSPLDFADAVTALHLQWFDNDSRPQVLQQYLDFRSGFRRFGMGGLPGIARFMRRGGYAAETESTHRCENYCIGTMLNDRIGAASMWCAVAADLLGAPPEISVVRVLGDFALFDAQERQMLVPAHDWHIENVTEPGHMESAPLRAVLEFAAFNLFSGAVNGDSFRYVLTLAQAVSGCPDERILEFLPYPYHPAEEPEEGDHNNQGEEASC